ncbi:hypothetical protein CJ030_MR3G009863 [Morella rubra]|uniref:Uncharacterized protein n=1 Tax=Morella rubra TaxID=262757 RepID=A0A6A1W689_9ROSI|nr:hypothetical protein CJ030_MR3G009863 [Morella rubra]
MTKRFTIPEPPLGDIVKSWFLKDLGEKWRNYKCSLKKYFDEAFTPHIEVMGKQNRSLQTTVHTAGSKSFARYAHELEQRQYQDVANNNQVSPAIHRSSHASRKTSVDNADDAESAGADGAEGGED